MAFKVVLVDDDLLVLQDLETLADWGKYGLIMPKRQLIWEYLIIF